MKRPLPITQPQGASSPWPPWPSALLSFMLLLNTCFVMKNTIQFLALRELPLKWKEIINNHHNLVPPFWPRIRSRVEDLRTVALFSFCYSQCRELSENPFFLTLLLLTSVKLSAQPEKLYHREHDWQLLQNVLCTFLSNSRYLLFAIIFSFAKWDRPIHFTRFLNELIMKVFEP